MKAEDKYKHIIKEYKARAGRYDQSCRKFLSLSHTAAVDALNPQANEKILDAGCGTGSVILSIAGAVGKGGRAAGIDMSGDMLDIARKKTSMYGWITLARGNLENIPYTDGYFDAVVNINVMHYFHNLRAVLCEFRRILKPGGRIVLAGFCTDYLFFRIVERLWRIFIPSHIRAYSLDELSCAVREAGFKPAGSKRFKAGWFWRFMVVKAMVCAPPP